MDVDAIMDHIEEHIYRKFGKIAIRDLYRGRNGQSILFYNHDNQEGYNIFVGYDGTLDVIKNVSYMYIKKFNNENDMYDAIDYLFAYLIGPPDIAYF